MEQMKVFTEKEIKELQAEGLYRKSLSAPTSEVKFPSDYLSRTDLNLSFSIYKQKLEKNFVDYQNFIISISLTDPDIKVKNKKQIDYLKAEQEKYSKVWSEVSNHTGRDLMLESVEEIKNAIARWDAFDIDWKNKCNEDSIDRLEKLILKAGTSSYKNLFQSYLDRLQGKKTGILITGNFDHKRIFDALKLNEIIDGDFNSWNYYFTGSECSNRKQITWKWKKSELLYFLSKYCVDFGTYEEKNRKISEANQIFGNVLKNNHEKTKSTAKTREIDKIIN
ncbi:MAG: hypothetical protein Q7U47_01090 [Paludibacter sp.]|nr:hypothetical protein [Paludibacter sp.]